MVTETRCVSRHATCYVTKPFVFNYLSAMQQICNICCFLRHFGLDKVEGKESDHEIMACCSAFPRKSRWCIRCTVVAHARRVDSYWHCPFRFLEFVLDAARDEIRPTMHTSEKPVDTRSVVDADYGIPLRLLGQPECQLKYKVI